jgi:hypothetical protein
MVLFGALALAAGLWAARLTGAVAKGPGPYYAIAPFFCVLGAGLGTAVGGSCMAVAAFLVLAAQPFSTPPPRTCLGRRPSSLVGPPFTWPASPSGQSGGGPDERFTRHLPRGAEGARAVTRKRLPR